MRKHVVTITGGNGGYTLLKGLAPYDIDITAIISGFDSGGSAGSIREEFGGISVGDIRRGIAALTPENESGKILRDLVSFRYDKKSSLNGHNFGNLLLTALSGMDNNQEAGIQKAHRLFGLSDGRTVIPPSFDNSHIVAELDNGELIKGETNIDLRRDDTSVKIRRIYLEPVAKAYPPALDAIQKADLIVLGPGDLYSSVLPNVVVEGISDAIKKSPAKVLYVCNTMTKRGETDHMKGSDFVKTVSEYIGRVPDFTLYNNNFTEGEKESIHLSFVDVDLDNIRNIGTDPLIFDLISSEHSDRHDSKKLGNVIVDLLKNLVVK